MLFPSLCMCIYMPAPPGQLRGISVPHHWRVRRPLFLFQPLSSFPPTSLFSTSSFTTSQFSPFPLTQRRSYASVVQLEDRANSETDNPQAQSRYLAVRMTNFWHSCMFYHCIQELIYCMLPLSTPTLDKIHIVFISVYAWIPFEHQSCGVHLQYRYMHATSRNRKANAISV